MIDAHGPRGQVEALAGRTWVALCHHPVLNRQGRVVATAITNLDLHDVARAARTYGLAGYLVITPVERQRHLAERIISHWRAEPPSERSAHRASAIALIRVVADLDAAIDEVRARQGSAPALVVTSARPSPGDVSSWRFVEERVSDPRPVLILFGTGWGLAEPVFARAEIRLQPLTGPSHYNHLSVRSAVSIYLDRMFGLRSR